MPGPKADLHDIYQCLEDLEDDLKSCMEGIRRHLGGGTRRAWRTYAAAAIAGMATTLSEDEIPPACHIAAAIADEMVRREGERAEGGPTP